jgi:hypothetical protein
MNKTTRKVIFHIAILGGITAALVICIVYPFLFGEYDGLAMALSTMAQVFGVLGLLLVPIGCAWFAYELWKQARHKRNIPVRTWGFIFALVSVIAGSLIALAISFAATASIGLSLGVISFALWLYIIARLVPGLRLLKHSESKNFNPVPVYLISIPVAVLVFQLMAAKPLTESSRNHAIAMSAQIIDDIEAYQAANGHYPSSLLALWNDYYPSVVSIRQFYYESNGEAYNLIFEQPRFLLDDFGVREFVVYNRLDEHRMISHNSWILILEAEELERNQGWFAVHDASSPHWTYFLFD